MQITIWISPDFVLFISFRFLFPGWLHDWLELFIRAFLHREFLYGVESRKRVSQIWLRLKLKLIFFGLRASISLARKNKVVVFELRTNDFLPVINTLGFFFPRASFALDDVLLLGLCWFKVYTWLEENRILLDFVRRDLVFGLSWPLLTGLFFTLLPHLQLLSIKNCSN